MWRDAVDEADSVHELLELEWLGDEIALPLPAGKFLEFLVDLSRLSLVNSLRTRAGRLKTHRPSRAASAPHF